MIAVSIVENFISVQEIYHGAKILQVPKEKNPVGKERKRRN